MRNIREVLFSNIKINFDKMDFNEYIIYMYI